MLEGSKAKTNLGVGLGLLLQLGGRILVDQESTVIFGFILILGGFIAFLWGCAHYAKGKGYSGWFGLLGLLSIIGLIILVLFPDKHKAQSQ